MDSDYTFLIGFSASNKNKTLGVIDDVFNMPANKLARVMQGQKELLIPLHNNFIVKIIKSKKEIHFDLPDGLLDL
jgi:16S rRNA processing protein RimM